MHLSNPFDEVWNDVHLEPVSVYGVKTIHIIWTCTMISKTMHMILRWSLARCPFATWWWGRWWGLKRWTFGTLQVWYLTSKTVPIWNLNDEVDDEVRNDDYLEPYQRMVLVVRDSAHLELEWWDRWWSLKRWTLGTLSVHGIGVSK